MTAAQKGMADSVINLLERWKSSNHTSKVHQILSGHSGNLFVISQVTYHHLLDDHDNRSPL